MEELPKLVAMEEAHLYQVESLIEAIDEDDAQAAMDSYAEYGFDDQYVFLGPQGVVGVTGFRRADDTLGSVWLSWTYIREDMQGQGLGKNMLKQLLALAEQQQVRKVFIGVSDYQDPETGEDIYHAAKKLYKRLGFSQDLVLYDYYDEGENYYVFAKELVTMYPSPEQITKLNKQWVKTPQCLEVFEISETDGSYAIAWQSAGKMNLFYDFSKELKKAERIAASFSARELFTTFCSSALNPKQADTLNLLGYEFAGELKDYFGLGINEVHFVKKLLVN